MEISGSEAPGAIDLQKIGAWISSPGGVQDAHDCDFLAPIAVDCTDWSQYGNFIEGKIVCVRSTS